MIVIDLPAEKVLDWEFQISLKRDVARWLLDIMGTADIKWWSDDDALEYHITNCVGSVRCGNADAKTRCHGEPWGWQPIFAKPRMGRFYFRNSDDAMLFKLTWGGDA